MDIQRNNEVYIYVRLIKLGHFSCHLFCGGVMDLSMVLNAMQHLYIRDLAKIE